MRFDAVRRKWNGRIATRGPRGKPQRWRRSRTSLASLTRAARYVDPPWSGCSFFISERWARPMSSRARAGLKAKDLIGLLFGHFAAARRARRRPRCRIAARAHASRGPGGQDTLQVERGCRSSISPSRPIKRLRDRAHRAARPCAAGENMAAHRAAVVIELHFEKGGSARARPCPDSSACARQSRPATASTQPSRPEPEGAERDARRRFGRATAERRQSSSAAPPPSAAQRRRGLLADRPWRTQLPAHKSSSENDDAEKQWHGHCYLICSSS